MCNVFILYSAVITRRKQLDFKKLLSGEYADEHLVQSDGELPGGSGDVPDAATDCDDSSLGTVYILFFSLHTAIRIEQNSYLVLKIY